MKVTNCDRFKIINIDENTELLWGYVVNLLFINIFHCFYEHIVHWGWMPRSTSCYWDASTDHTLSDLAVCWKTWLQRVYHHIYLISKKLFLKMSLEDQIISESKGTVDERILGYKTQPLNVHPYLRSAYNRGNTKFLSNNCSQIHNLKCSQLVNKICYDHLNQ